MLVVVLATSIALREYFLRQTKVDLIDDQLRSTAALVLRSDVNAFKRAEFERVDQILNEELGDGQIGKFFILRDASGKILFDSASGKNLPPKEFPTSPKWLTVEKGDLYIRVLNLELASIPDRFLQTGIVVDKGFLLSNIFSLKHMAFRGLIFLSGLIVAWVLVSTLLRPLSLLANFVSGVALSPRQRVEIPMLPPSLRKAMQHKRFYNDELHRLLGGFEAMIERINRDYKITRLWSYQMAHELKTPMALMEAQITAAQSAGTISQSVASNLLDEVFEVSETITSFLTWAEVENPADRSKRLFAVKASAVLAELSERLSISFPKRLEINVADDFYVLANQQHLEQVINNLVVNALIYSPPEQKVTVDLVGQTLTVTDRGAGISEGVIERMGEPFNKGDAISGTQSAGDFKRRGSGLGLALVHSVCNLYGWRLDLKTGSEGTRVSIEFPVVDGE